MQLLLVTLLSAPLFFATAAGPNHLVVAPEAPVLEIGTNFTATCKIIDTAAITADALYWNVSKTTVPKEQYSKINNSTLNVTISVAGEKPEWLLCLTKPVSPFVVFNRGRFMHGIYLTKGYFPKKPENLSCMAVQEDTDLSPISPTLTCVWEPVGRQTPEVPTEYTLNVKIHLQEKTFTVPAHENGSQVTLDIFPHHMTLEIWVEARNKLGQTESEHLKEDAGWFVKTNPPKNISVISEKAFSTSLLINWTHPIPSQYLFLTYQIRFCINGSQSWTYVPPRDTAQDIQSFRLQNLQPNKVYAAQVRCKNAKEGQGYWSDWSTNATGWTPEGQPSSKPDLWRIITEGDSLNKQRVQFICKDPVNANGRLLRYDITVQDPKGPKVKNGSLESESIPINRSEADSSSGQWELIKEIQLADKKSVKVSVTASNSVGKSPEASLGIPEKAHGYPAVQELKVWPHEGQLWVQWKSLNAASEYVVEWVSSGQIDWQRESKRSNRTTIKGKLEKFVCYNVSVYPVFSGLWTGKPATLQVYLEQGVPSEAPSVRMNALAGCDKAELVWSHIPQHSRRGFITNYTIHYASGTEMHAITVPANTTSYTLRSLSRNTKYDVWISVSTIRGSARGSNHSFTTPKYAPGEIEGIVVGVSFGFLFVFLLTMLICIYKKDVIKENFWPQIPNPGESTIGNWSPDYPLKAETPKENCISVLDVDVCDGKCVFEEDKASLPLKKDKYLSEEHSSGIGGSSCMSSPRQSVSDSDEGGDMADTTASTVQYSSVVASNGYKGQTPSSQPQQAIFSRSESTQPLLDSEENPDMLVQEGSRQSQRFLRQPCFRHNARNKDSAEPADFNQLEMEQQEVLEHLDFCPLEEDSEQMTPTDGQSADWLPPAPVSSYMPQLGGYRPQ
ncbi:interleukin-6 receptor subunit beta [Symphorus nematophorus]